MPSLQVPEDIKKEKMEKESEMKVQLAKNNDALQQISKMLEEMDIKS